MTLQEAITATVAAAVSAALDPIRARLAALESNSDVTPEDRALLDQLAAFIGAAPSVPADPNGAITLPDINP